jgi:hypothetical protein
MMGSRAMATPDPPPVAKKKFQRALARRMLLLPLGVVQPGAMFSLESVRVESGTRNRGFIDPRLRIGIGIGELEVAGSILAYEPSSTGGDDPARFVTAFAAAKLKLLANTAFGAELAVRNPAADARIYAPRAVVATKLRPTLASGIEVALKAGVDGSGAGDRMYVASGELRLQAQATAELAFEARGLITYVRPDDELVDTAMARRSFAQTYGFRIVGGVSHELDVIAGFDLTAARDRETVKLFSLGFAARRVP